MTPMPSKPIGHFRKKGDRRIDGVWKTAEELAVPVKVRHIATAADRRNWLRKQAGWPALRG